MSEAMLIAVINLVSKVGIDAAEIILTNMAKASTIDDAIKALQEAKQFNWNKAKQG